MKEKNLLVSLKRAGQTTKSLQGEKPWSNLLEDLEVSHPDQVWVADITYVRLKGRFIYLSLLMDVFTRVIRAWQLSQHLNQSLTLRSAQSGIVPQQPGDSPFRSRRAVSFKNLCDHAPRTWHQDFGRTPRKSLGRTDMRKDSFAPSNRTFYRIRVSPKTPAFGVTVFDTYGISTQNLILILRNCGLNKRMHFKFFRF